MEYPMICFNWGRPKTKEELIAQYQVPKEAGEELYKKYNQHVKWITISVIIHEVGHNFFSYDYQFGRTTVGPGWMKDSIPLCST